MKKLWLAAAVLVVVSSSASAQVSPKLKEWGEGAVRHLMTKEESKQWSALRSDAEAQAFIDLFWAKRDPTPTTARNEFRDDFEQRVAFADKNFSNGKMPGSMTDPGRVFILLGPPFRVTGKAGENAQGMGTFGGNTAPTDSAGGLTVGRATREPDKQYWMYAHERKPKFIPQNDFTLVFADEGHNDWKLAFTERANPEIILQQAVKGVIISPNLTKVPVYETPATLRVTAFKSAELKSAYEQLKSAATQTVGNASLTWGEFVTSDGEHFVSAQLDVPSGGDVAAGQKVTSFAVVENAAGEIVDIKENDTTLTASGTDTYVDTSIPLDAGTYTATFGIASQGRVLAASRTPVKIEGLDPNAAGVSPLLLATSIYPMKTTWHPDDPFTFGGLKVVPKGDAAFPATGDLWYFIELRNPGVTDAGVPNVRVQIDIKGKTAKGPVEMRLPMSDAKVTKLQGETKRYALGQAIPLDGFIPGDYTIKIKVHDVSLGKDYELTKPFRVRSSS